MNRRHHCLALAAALLAGAAGAQDAFPNRPVQLIVPFPPGGAVDIMARKLADLWKTEFGQPVLVVNRPGANGVVAWQSLASQPPDGHNVFAAAGQGLGFIHKMNPRIATPFLNDLVPVGSYANYPLVAEATRRATEDKEFGRLLAELYLENEFLDGAGARRQFELRASQFEPLIRKLDIKLQ